MTSNTTNPSHGQGSHAGPSIQERLGSMIAHYIDNNDDASLGPKKKDDWPAEAPRALLAPWEERMAEDGHLEGLMHLLDKNTFKKDEQADINDICDMKPYPQYKKEWDRVRELYKKGKAARKIRRPREVAPVDVELKGPSETDYGDYMDSGDSMTSGDSTDSSRYTDSGQSSDSGDSSDESDSPPPVRRSKRLVKSIGTKYHAGRAPKLANIRRSKRLMKDDDDSKRTSKRLKRSQESEEEQDSTMDEYNTSIDWNMTESSSEEEAPRIRRRVGNARPVVPDSTDEEADSVDLSETSTNTGTSESEEEENLRIPARFGGRSRPIIQDSDDESSASTNNQEDTRADSESSDDIDNTRAPTRASGRGRRVVYDSEDSTDTSDEAESSDASSGDQTDEEILNIPDTVTGPINTSNFVRRSTRSVAPRQYF